MALVKYMLFVSNFALWIGGICLLYFGSLTQYYDRVYVDLIGYKIFVIPLVLLVFGAFITLISFLGCWGAIRESYGVMIIFSIVLIVICLTESSLALAAYLSKEELQSVITRKVKESLSKHTVKAESLSMWDALQRNFNCCGAHNFTDWSSEVPYYQVYNRLPQSCCGYRVPEFEALSWDEVVYCNPTTTLEDLHAEGCLQQLIHWIDKNASLIRTIGLTLGAFQVLGILFSCCLARQIKMEYSYYYTYYYQ